MLELSVRGSRSFIGRQMGAWLTDLADKVASDRRSSIVVAIQLPLTSDSSDIFEQRQDAAAVVFFNLSTGQQAPSEAERAKETPEEMFFNFTTMPHRSQPMFVFNLTAKPRQNTAPVVFFNLTTTLPRQDTSPNITRYAYQEYQQAPFEGAYTTQPSPPTPPAVPPLQAALPPAASAKEMPAAAPAGC